MAGAAECCSSSCSRLACVQAAARARVAGKDGIHKAAERGDVAAVQDYLIADASCLNQPGSYGYDWMPPAPACIAVFAMLISCSIRPTPLHCAAQDGRVGVVQLLLSCNAAVEARSGVCRPYHCIVQENALLISCCVLPLILAPDFLLL
jgi:hypothetical protein